MDIPIPTNESNKYILYFSSILSLLMIAVFVLLKKWDVTILLGTILSLLIGTLNFFFMGITVQKAVLLDVNDAKKLMKSSQTLRNAGMFLLIALGVALPYFNTISVILPLFFPRIAVSFRPLIKDKKDVIDK